ncbi:hypothetical protein [Tenacibaculum ovolyticum]|uniref:hypothetical protein n=1 Tax=Tenacibaculum ovolyticum TaxID=104270 RepID=UPI003BACF320
MKNGILLLFISILLSCNSKENLKKPTWLIGKWKRTNEKPTKSTFDFWNNDLTGIGFTLKNSDTIFKEKMSIITIKDTLHLKIEGVNEAPTLFKFTQHSDSSFVCENQKNEFPKKIHYFLDKQQLKCKISNNEFSVDFIFDNIKN